MRYIKIFLLHFENVLEYRSRAFVWFLFSILSTTMFLLFWRARYASGNPLPGGWTLQDITNYYLLFMFSASTLMSHIEGDVADFDIYRGEMNKFILKPYNYYLAKFYVEFPYRMLQGFYALVILIGLSIFLPNIFALELTPIILFLGLISGIIAFLLSQTFKMVLGLIAFWFTDAWYAFEFFDMLAILFAGMTVPLVFFPEPMQTIAFILPFGHMLYTPVAIFMGKLSLFQSLYYIGFQIFWLCIFIVIYKIMFRAGIKRFTGVSD